MQGREQEFDSLAQKLHFNNKEGKQPQLAFFSWGCIDCHCAMAWVQQPEWGDLGGPNGPDLRDLGEVPTLEWLSDGLQWGGRVIIGSTFVH